MKNFKNLIKEAHLGNPLNENEYDDEDIVIYDGEEHIIMSRDGNMIYIRPLEDSAILGKRDVIKVPARALAYKSDLDKMYDEYKPKDELDENEKFDEVSMDEYGKPWMELSIAQKQEMLSYMNRETEKEFETDFERRRKGDYSDDMEDGMTDYERRSMDEDINDPALMKARAAQIADEKEMARQAALDKKYGSNFMDKLDAEINLKQELQDLKDEREQLMIDMEQEAEPEGGEIADLYGMKLNRIDLRTAEIKSELDDLRMYESVVNEFGPMSGSGNRNYSTNDLVDRIGDLEDILMSNRKAEREWEEMSQNYLDGEKGSEYWGDLEDHEIQDAIDDAESLMKKYRIKESVVNEDLDIGHQDDEPSMLKSELARAGQMIQMLYRAVDKYDDIEGEVDFPQWWQAKIIKANTLLDSAFDYLAGEEDVARIDAMIDRIDMDESDLDEGTCGYGEDGVIGDEPAGPDLNEDEIPMYLTSNDAFRKAVEDSVSYNDFEKRVYGILGNKYFKLAKIENPDAFKDFYDSIRGNKPKMEEAFDLDIDDAHGGEGELDNAVARMGYNESLKKSLKESLNKKLGK